MQTFNAGHLDKDLFKEFLEEFEDNRGMAESLILSLEQGPGDKESLRALFRAVHTIKGTLGLLGVDPLVQLLQELEDVLQLLWEGVIVFENYVGDLTLLLLDKTASFLDQCRQFEEIEYDGNLWQQVGSQIAKVNAKVKDQDYQDQQLIFTQALALLDPAIANIYPQKPTSELLKASGLTQHPDLLFFFSLMDAIERRADFWQGRSMRVASILTKLNEDLGYPVSDEQLIMAATVHDISMAMLPEQLLYKQSLDNNDRQQLSAHVNLACDMLDPYKGWETALAIVAHHHERWDGKGYPQALSGSQIHIGARMLSVTHAYEAIRNGFTRFSGQKRPLMRALMEVIRHAGTQFDPDVSDAFIKMLQEKERVRNSL